MSQDKFIEVIGGAAIRGPIIKISCLASRLQPQKEGNKVDTVLVHDGDLILPVEAAVRLHGALSTVIEQLVKQGVLVQKKPEDAAPAVEK
ncbi:MAG: hypothetical protein HZC24_10145 [Rhodocyclales bacterium]|nr:hypothetical protein [Rhodocyclales bacterium]